MINEIIELLPSADLKAKIKETNHQFKENELLQIIYRYAPTFDTRIDLLERFSSIASSDVAALAKVYIEYERENFSRFIEAPEGFVYEIYIKDIPDAYEEKYLCSSYQAALVCIDRFYEEYADIDAKENEKSRYRIIKRKVFSENDTFEEDAYAECVLGANKTVLEVSDYRNPADCESEVMCSECKEICSRRCDDLSFPCFAHNYAVIKYQDYKGLEHFGVNICLEKCDGMAQKLYVIPLDSSEIREHRFDADFFDHVHLELPLATLASPDDLDETMRKNYFDFVAYWRSQAQPSGDKKIAVCDECGSEFLAASSKMASLCPECAHVLYGYENCDHLFKDGKCTLCLWDGSRSDYINKLLKNSKG